MIRQVQIDLDGRCVCPVHGPQDCEYLPGVAPCGCVWVALRHGRLGVKAAQVPALSPDLACASVVGYKTNDIAQVAETRNFAV